MFPAPHYLIRFWRSGSGRAIGLDWAQEGNNATGGEFFAKKKWVQPALVTVLLRYAHDRSLGTLFTSFLLVLLPEFLPMDMMPSSLGICIRSLQVTCAAVILYLCHFYYD